MKILLVEDEPTIRDMLGETLGKWGYEEVSVDDFSLVLQVFLAEMPHLVVMDINLPVFDGFYWCKAIRQISNVPILFLSSRSTPMDVVMSISMGGDDYVQKPFYEEVLLAKIQALLRRTYSYGDALPDIRQHDGVTLNLANGDVLFGDKKAELTKNELKILNVLMQNIHAIVSREKIMRSLWQDENFVDENTLTVNIARLRKKLADIGKGDFIGTRRGEGYIIQ